MMTTIEARHFDLPIPGTVRVDCDVMLNRFGETEVNAIFVEIPYLTATGAVGTVWRAADEIAPLHVLAAADRELTTEYLRESAMAYVEGLEEPCGR